MKWMMNRIKYLIINIIVIIIGCVIKRDQSIWLFGSWMGSRYADNTRYMFDYVSNNLTELSCKKAVWVTRDKELYNEIQSLGYEVYMMTSLQSVFYHLRAGVHVVCNMPFSRDRYHGDIIGELSAGSVRIQLWHGVGVKAVGNLRVKDLSKRNNILYKFIKSSFIFTNKWFNPGMWNDCFQIATGKENARVAIEDLGIKENNIIYTNYPRLTGNVSLLPYEKSIIEKFSDLKKDKKVILYLPTFREKDLDTIVINHPLASDSFRDYIISQNILWVEKMHLANTIDFDIIQNDNVFLFPKEFDINLIYDCVDCLITDYSSASSDCIYKGISVISYIPDYDYYLTKERGLVNDYHLYYPGPFVYSLNELIIAINNLINNDASTLKDATKKTRNYLFETNDMTISAVYNTVSNAIKVNNGVKK